MDFFRAELNAFNALDDRPELISKAKDVMRIRELLNEGDYFGGSPSLLGALAAQIVFIRYTSAKELNNGYVVPGLANFVARLVGAGNKVQDDLARTQEAVDIIKRSEVGLKSIAGLEIAVRIVFGYFIALIVDLLLLLTGDTEFYCLKTNTTTIIEIAIAWKRFNATYNAPPTD